MSNVRVVPRQAATPPRSGCYLSHSGPAFSGASPRPLLLKVEDPSATAPERVVSHSSILMGTGSKATAAGVSISSALPHHEPEVWLAQEIEKLRGLRGLPRNWDSYDAEPPNPTAIFWAEQALESTSLIGYRPGWIDPSAEGGVVLSFRNGSNFGSIEFYNSGSIVALISDGQGHIDVWSVSQGARSIEDALTKIHEHTDG